VRKPIHGKGLISQIFFSFANNILVIGPTFTIHLAFDHFVSQLTLMGLMIQPCKCSTWLPSNLHPDFFSFYWFCCPLIDTKVLGILFGFTFFFNGILLNEDVRHVEMFPRLRDIISSPPLT
jgi:hypothetical protein